MWEFHDYTKPHKDGLHEIIINRYWIVHYDTGQPLFYRLRKGTPLEPQCNTSKDLIWQIANSMHKNYPAKVKIKRLKYVYIPRRRNDL